MRLTQSTMPSTARLMTKKTEDGWAWPRFATKAHYFRDGVSLCRKWASFGRPSHPATEGDTPNMDDCLMCFRRSRQRKYMT